MKQKQIQKAEKKTEKKHECNHCYRVRTNTERMWRCEICGAFFMWG